jgi:hypothetical protein
MGIEAWGLRSLPYYKAFAIELMHDDTVPFAATFHSAFLD